MFFEQRQPILLRMRRQIFVRLEQVFVRRERLKIAVGRATGLAPIIRADEHDQALLRRLDHVSERFLQHRIAIFDRQQRENITVGRETFSEPEISVVGQQQTDHQCPEPRRHGAPVQNRAASSGFMAPWPAWIAENSISVRSPLASLKTMLLTYAPPSNAMPLITLLKPGSRGLSLTLQLLS